MSQDTPFSTNPLTPSTAIRLANVQAPSSMTPLAAADAANAAACRRDCGKCVRFRWVAFGMMVRRRGFSTDDSIGAMASMNRLSVARSGSLSGVPESVSLCFDFEKGEASCNDRAPGARFVRQPPSWSRPKRRINSVSRSLIASRSPLRRSISYTMGCLARHIERMTFSLWSFVRQLLACRASFSWKKTRGPAPCPT